MEVLLGISNKHVHIIHGSVSAKSIIEQIKSVLSIR